MLDVIRKCKWGSVACLDKNMKVCLNKILVDA